jgi:hypothetical protein
MDVIIGLGSAGCKIADEFSAYPQYDIYKIDVGISGDRCYSMPPKTTPEDYERAVPDMSTFFADVSGDVLFIVGGGGKISGATLQILKQIKNSTLHLLYIKPYAKALTKLGMLQDRVTFNVLQEYARSGIFKKMFIVDNTVLETIVGDVPILEYNKKLNEVLVSDFHYINVFNHTEPVLQNIEPPKETQRICTLGIYDPKNNSETPFFELQNVGHKCYYYAVPEQVLKSDGKLFKMIKEKAAEEQSSYQIHTTKHAETFAYFLAHSSYIQSVDNLQ